MFTRVLIYDLKFANADDYQYLYNYFSSVNAEQLTESSYFIKSSLNWDDFKKRIINLTKNGDNIKAIVFGNDGLEVRTIR